MNRLRSVSPKVRRYVLLAVLLLACTLYVWQMAASWADQFGVEESSAGADVRTLFPNTNSISVILQGTGTASTARGILTYDFIEVEGGITSPGGPVVLRNE